MEETSHCRRSELPVPLLPPLIFGGQHVPVRERPKWPTGQPTSYGPEGPPPAATKRRPEENPIASAKRWRESRADAAQLSTATTTSCAESMNPAG